MEDKLKKLILLMEIKNEEKFSDFSKSIEQLDKQDINISNDIDLLYKELSKIEDSIKSFDVSEQIKELKSDIENIQLQKGDKGDNGEDGYTPIKGIDYFDGKDGRDGKDGKDGENGDKGEDGKDGSPDTGEQIVEKINTLENVIEIKTIKDFPNIESTVAIKRQVETIGNQVLRLLSKQPQTVDLSAYVPTTRTLTINGTTQDLSSNRTWTIAVPTKTSDLTNDSGFITSSALTGYATQAWVTSQGYITNVISALGYTPENVANKSTTTSLGTSDTLYPSQKAVKTYADTKLALTGGTMTGYFATATSALSDGANVAVDASLANIFTLTAAGNRTISPPTNAVNGQRITIYHKASGADRTLTLSTSAGGFIFGTDITALTATTSGLTDLIGCEYNSTISKWLVVAYVKGFTI